ncbi:fasciclin domain-containing protein [Mycolicibacterium brumae]|uniref:Fasciclin n=1 Tax=Mycolicibacterium brumae TaxID=85968 RepID=A0A2G5PEM0_9MYCO|nr:fasciclin domain-containing protein [Mycolicibacterium brumae]MCV7192036.1 fasciclin domain-containing protein [Mycolicibacterium brumae]PIB76761.1 fasciclin [Mycolicibacterium brumae]RWA20702.1 hypothetical protein MBRU_03320 [Mycolicibacterium brumae DSM 44177]UWW07801.1 fasciclin domain-containing protein [Mycolicibacterium brumae]
MRIHNSRKTFGAFTAAVALTVALPMGIANADDPKPPREPEGPACGAYKEAHPSGSAAFTSMATVPASQAIANNPDLSTFSSAISGGLNPEVNIAAVLDNGPYVVFAPTNDAFAKLAPATMEALKTDTPYLYSIVYYHMALGLLTPKTVQGKMTSQEGRQLTIEGKGDNITVDGVAKVTCGGITAQNAQIYMIDTVLDPAGSQPAYEGEPTATSTTEAPAESTTEATPTEETSATESAAPASGEEATTEESAAATTSEEAATEGEN